MSEAWETNNPSSLAMEDSVRCFLAEAMARAWSRPMAPSCQAWAHAGRWRSSLPRRTRRRAALRGTRHLVAIHAEAVLAPSAAHSSPTSKAAIASVTKDSKRASCRCSSSMEAQSP